MALPVRSSIYRWLAICVLLTPAAARAELPAVTRLPPVTDSTGDQDSSVVQASYYEPVASDVPVTIMPVQSPSPPPSVLGSSAPAGLGQYRRTLRPFVGIETVFLAPVHNTGGGGANYTISDGSSSASYNASGVNGMVATPRIWLGLMNDRWGVGVRYWGFANNPAGAQFPGGSSQGVYSQGMLKLDTIDLEAIRRFQFAGGQQLWFTVGTRYAQFGRNSTEVSGDIFGHGLYTASASSGSQFSGAGLTTSLSGLCPIGTSQWNLFYGGRVSYLPLGSSSAYAQASASYQSNTVGAASVYPAASLGNGNAFIGELQLGAQYNRALEIMPATVFFRIALEYQYWHVNNGASASADANAGPLSGGLVSSSAAAGNSNLGLLGFGVATGFAW